MKTWLYRWLLGGLQKRCEHPYQLVTADILQGDHAISVSHCKICGSYYTGAGGWQQVRADFWRNGP